MATVLQVKGFNGQTSNPTLAFNNPLTPGSTLLVAAFSRATLSAPTDSASHVWVLRNSQTPGSSTGGVWTATNGGSTTPTITLPTSASNFVSFFIAELSPGSTFNSISGASGTGSALSSGATAAVGTNGGLHVGVFLIDGGQDTTMTAPTETLHLTGSPGVSMAGSFGTATKTSGQTATTTGTFPTNDGYFIWSILFDDSPLYPVETVAQDLTFGTTSPSVTFGSIPADGETVTLHVYEGNTAGLTCTPPAGGGAWTTYSHLATPAGINMWIFVKIAASEVSATYTCTFSASGNNVEMEGTRWKGANTSGPIEVAPVWSDIAYAATVIAPDVTTLTANAAHVAGFTSNDQTFKSTPTGYTDLTPTMTYPRIYQTYKVIPTPSATGALTIAPAGGPVGPTTFSYVIKPSAGGAPTAPGAPTSVVATAGIGSASLTWTAPASDGGSAITDYLVEYAPSPFSSWSTFSHTASTTPSITVTGLTAGTTYQFRISAINAIGTGTASVNSNSATIPDVPGAPTINAGGYGWNNATSLTATAPGSNGGSAITAYQWDYALASAPTSWLGPYGTTTSTPDVRILNAGIITLGTAYVFRVRAVNAVGNGAWSATSSSVTPGDASGYVSLQDGASKLLLQDGASRVVLQPGAAAGGATATATLIAAVVSMPAAARSGGSNTVPSVLNAVVSMPAATAAGTFVATTPVTQVVATMPAAAATAGGSRTTTSLPIPATMPAAAASGGGTTSPGVLNANVTMPAAAASAPASAAATLITVAVSAPAAAASGGASTTTSPIAAAVTAPSATATGGGARTTTSIAVPVSMPAPSVSGGAGASTAPIAVPVAMPSAAASGGGTRTTTSIQAAATLPTASVTGGGATTTSPIPVPVTLPLVSASASSAGSAAPTPIAVSTSMPATAPSAGSNVGTVPVNVSVLVPGAAVSAGGSRVTQPIIVVVSAPVAGGATGGTATSSSIVVVTSAPLPSVKTGGTAVSLPTSITVAMPPSVAAGSATAQANTILATVILLALSASTAAYVSRLRVFHNGAWVTVVPTTYDPQSNTWRADARIKVYDPVRGLWFAVLQAL